MTHTLDDLQFNNRFTRELPADPNSVNSRRQVFEACFSRVEPTAVAAPQTIGWSKEVAELIGLDPAECESEKFARVFGGNELLPDMDSFAMCYGGHQFGNWAGQLGDGRAINLGEVRTDAGDHFTLQLKGAGPTPYSRTADGLAVLRSSIREFLCSEAMFHLGVPTTRALSLVLTGEKVMRDMFYDGNAGFEPGAVVCRVAPSFVRLGSFQIFAARKDLKTLRQLVDFTIRNDFAHLVKDCPLGEDLPDNVIVEWFRKVCELTANMIVHWQRVGFVHGVMNTDNLSILGLTIDYGPYGWLEGYDPGWTPNTTDASGKRYRFGNQPQIAHWNLYQLANSLYSLIDEAEPLEAALQHYADTFNKGFYEMMAAKMGLDEFRPDTDEDLVNGLFQTLQLTETDMTIFFRQLADVSAEDCVQAEAVPSALHDAFYAASEVEGEVLKQWTTWLTAFGDRLKAQALSPEDRRNAMNAVNPKYVLRNYMAQLAIDASTDGDHSLIAELLELLRRPYDEQPDMEKYFARRPEWARERAGCSMLSCSS